MFRRLFVTLTVTTALSGLYVLYSLAVTPRLVPSAKFPRPSVDPYEVESLPPPGNVEDAERFLPEAPWAARAKFQIRLAKGLLYSESWRPIDEAQDIFEFRPFAMIWFDAPNADGDNGDDATTRQRPLTLIADAGLIRFSSKFEPTSQKIGRVIDGKLVGQVSATGPNGMSLKGQDLFFSEQKMKLYSDAPIEFTYQQHQGHADHGLQVELLPSNEPSRPDQTISIGGFRRVLLRGHVKMQLSTNDGPMHVACDEGFDFNHESRTASFKTNVAVTRPDAADSLRCQCLDLFLEDDPAVTDETQRMSRGDAPGVVPIAQSNVGSNGEVGSRNAEDVAAKMPNIPATGFGRLALRKLRATGPRVELESKRNGLIAFMTSLVHDVASRTTVLKDEDAKSVIVRQPGQGNELRCPEITLVQDEQGQIESAHGYGAGGLRRREPGAEELDFAAEWRSEFHLQPDPDSDLDMLTLLGRVDVSQPTKDTRLSAEQIRLWFDRPESAARRLQPRQLQAQDNVEVVSPQLTGQSPRLIVFFEESSPRPSQLADDAESPRRVRPLSRRSTTSDADENAHERNLRDETQAWSSNDSPDEPLQLTAMLIIAKVKLASQSVARELSEVWTEGNVDVKQARGSGEEPLHLTGQRLHLRSSGGDGQVLHVFGQPAVIRDRGFDIEGNEVFLDRRKNVTWINGAGALRLPVKNDLDGRKLGSPSLLTVLWKEKMIFDGQTATFIDDVKAALNDSGLQCAEMDVVLTERFSFSGDRRHAPQAEVRKVICKDGVEIDHSLYVDQELTEIRRGRFATLTLDQMTGATEAIGPGQVAVWRPGRGKRAALAPRAVAQANRPLESEVSNWEFTRVTFFGKTTGNMRDRQTSFHDRVSIVYGPVAHPLDTIDPDYLPKDGGEMQCDKLQILQQQEAATKKSYIELRAEGNAKLEGRTFNAQADAISFDESKELYTLRSTGSRQVTIWRQTQPGGDPDRLSAKSMHFIPSRNYLVSDRTTGIQGSH